MTLLIHAQAKLNLRLKILARESSGYHCVETVFHKIELADDVALALQPPGVRTMRCSVDVGPAEQNLAYRAALAFLERTEWETGFEISITKRIPAGGGLGGGSSDAAATLRGLNKLAPQPLSMRHLMDIAAELGSDVPFLISDAPMALAWGRGGRLLALDALPQQYVALVTPNFRIATSEAYGWLAAPKEGYIQEAEELHYWHLANWDGIALWATNDFQAVVAGRFPVLTGIIHALLSNGASMAQMTGSGSTVFGIFASPPDAEALERVIGFPVIVTRSASVGQFRL